MDVRAAVTGLVIAILTAPAWTAVFDGFGTVFARLHQASPQTGPFAQSADSVNSAAQSSLSLMELVSNIEPLVYLFVIVVAAYGFLIRLA